MVREGEVHATERHYMEVVAGPQRGRSRSVRGRARAPNSPLSSKGEVACLFDEIGNLVDPTERLHMDVQAGLTSHGWRGVARTARPDGEYPADEEGGKDESFYV